MEQYPLLHTKLYIPPVRPGLVSRPRLIARLDAGLDRAPGMTLISAPAGYGKTTLLSEWIADCERPVAWLSLDKGDSDPTRFLVYLVVALRTLPQPAPGEAEGSEVEGAAVPQSPDGRIGQGVLAMLRAAQPQPLPIESVLTALLNEIATIPDHFILVLDDYHVIDAKLIDTSTTVDDALSFLLEHLPPQMHLVIATREDPHLPLARYRALAQLTEIRASDLRFTPTEAADFLNQVMGLNLSAEDIAALETRTEGWIAGLQLAALALQGLDSPEIPSMQGHRDATDFIETFTGSHHFVLDYLVAEVLQQQPASVQAFLLRTSILDRLCGPLCDAVRFGKAKSPSISNGTAVRFGKAETPGNSSGTAVTDEKTGQETLEYLEQANLFLIPLDDERRWYRYHPLFADLLRQRLHQRLASSAQGEERSLAEYHIRASEWYEAHGLGIEAFHHAAAANDVARAERLMEGAGVPLHFRGALASILDWLASLPTTVLNDRPSLWVRYASLLLVAGQTTGVEEKLQAAEAALATAALPGAEPVLPASSEAEGSAAKGPDVETRNLIGHIAVARAVLALTQYQVETMMAQSRRALAYLRPDNLPLRVTAMWTMAQSYQLRGDRAAAGRVFTEAIAISQAAGDTFSTMLATIGLGQVQEAENQLYLAAETYRHALQLAGDRPFQILCDAHLGLARVLYEWNDLDAAGQHGQQGLQLARQYENVIDRSVLCEVFLARLKLARGDGTGAAAMLAETERTVRQRNFVHRMPEVAAARVRVLLRQGSLPRQADLAVAAYLAEKHQLPLSRARVYLAQGDPSSALAVLDPLRQQMEARGWQDERLKVMILQAVALQACGKEDEAVHLLGEALALAEPGGLIRIFVDEGPPIAHLLSEAAARGTMPNYIGLLLAAFEAEKQRTTDESPPPASGQPLVEPLSQRELEILRLVAQGLSNREIGERLFLALSTVKTHNRNIFGKLQVRRRTEAVARARELGLL